ncbi:MAG: hypothetical protein E7658_04395 [Ruminococcaceae bacterium]|nr:hypothetical protein [Oscillospiraceae bacterium]
MENVTYKCPNCGASLDFGAATGQMQCAYCDSVFDVETLCDLANEETAAPEETDWEQENPDNHWTEEEEASLRSYVCKFCGAEVLTDATTAASRCPYCDNNLIFASQLSGSLKPDVVIPFKITKKQAEEALKQFCSGKFLLPKSYHTESRIEEIKGVYVPFWLYDCTAEGNIRYDARNVRTWSDRNYIYTKTDHYLVERTARMGFANIPEDGSTKADDNYMEALEPFDYGELRDFDMPYLSGFLADRYDVTAEECRSRAETRIRNSVEQEIAKTVHGYQSMSVRSRQVHMDAGKVRYGLLPVWMLSTQYKDKIYRFAMNGQTGKFVGELPIDRAKFWGLFAAIAAAGAVIGGIVGMIGI